MAEGKGGGGGWLAVAGIGLSMLSAYTSSKSQADNIRASNKARAEQFENNISIVAEMLGTMDSRTSRAEAEAVRASIRTKLNVRKAQIKATGDAAVRAAQIGGGSGKRASLSIFRPAARIAGDIITDANVNLQTELTNITEHFNDTADKAIANLNNNTPIMGTPPSTGEMLLSAGSAGLNVWNSLSGPSKEGIKGLFESNSGDVTEPVLLT